MPLGSGLLVLLNLCMKFKTTSICIVKINHNQIDELEYWNILNGNSKTYQNQIVELHPKNILYENTQIDIAH